MKIKNSEVPFSDTCGTQERWVGCYVPIL